MFKMFIELDYRKSNFIGSESEVKFFQFRNIHFYDVYAMLGKTMSLSQACASFNSAEYQKKDQYDFKLVKTWKDVEEKQEMIEKYNLNDVIILQKLHENLIELVY
jgi:hypothetical protein